MGSEENRTAFVKTVTDFAKKYKLDGLDFEYVSPSDMIYTVSILTFYFYFSVGSIPRVQALDAMP